MDEEHAKRLDGNYRYQRHVYDLSREYYLLGRQTLIAGLTPPKSGQVLEIGCGTARNLIRAARLYPDCQYYGVDLSRLMLETAKDSVKRSGFGRRITLGLGDAAGFEPEHLFGIARFDRVFFSYSLSMIPPWEKALEHALGLLAPHGSLHVVDFGPADRLPALFRRALYGWLARFHVSPRTELAAVLRRLAESRQMEHFTSDLYRGYATYAVVTAA